MGVLILDHRSTCDPTGTRDGVLEEYATISCPHCQAIIRKVITGPCRTRVDSPGQCDYCRRPICRACADRLRATEHCPGEMRERVDRAWQNMRSKETLWHAVRR